MIYLCITIILAYFIYQLFIVPIRTKASYIRMFKANGYKVYQWPYNLFGAPFMGDWLQTQKTKNDHNYSGKHIYSDSYDVAISNVFMRPEVIFFNEKLIKAFHDKDLQMKMPKFNVGFQILGSTVKRGLVFIDKDVWRHRRRILSKVFNFDFIVSQIPVMIHSADMIFQRFEEEYWQQHPEDKEQKRIKITLYDQIAKYTSSIIMAGFLGMDSMKEQFRGKNIQDQIIRLTDKSIMLSREPLNMMFGQRFLKLGLRKMDRDFLAHNKQVNQILGSYIKQYREQHKQKQQSNRKLTTIIELILQQIQKQSKTQNKETEVITDQDLVDDIKTFIIAGTDTTSNYLTMLLLYIYQNQQALKRLREEISVHIKSDEDITLENMKNIKFLDFVMAQGSRLFGAAETGFQRVLNEDAAICDIPLKKGTCLNIYMRPLYSNPTLFKDPLAFKPERWQAQTEQNKHLLQLLSFQFYGGPRGCIGKHLALTQTKVGIIKFLRRYKTLVEPQRQNRRFQFQLTGHIINSGVQLQRNL